ncbi:MAG: hypothetical protein ACOY5F_14375 [Pseudomonadota bacterium]
MKLYAKHARAILIGDRFFYRFGKSGQFITAWCLAGATLYQSGTDHDIAPVLRRLEKAGRRFRVITITAEIDP